MNASAVGIGSVWKKISGSGKPISFFFFFFLFSKKLTNSPEEIQQFWEKIVCYLHNCFVTSGIFRRGETILHLHQPHIGAFQSKFGKVFLCYSSPLISDIWKELKNIPADTMSRTINAIFFGSVYRNDRIWEQLKDQHLQKLLRDNSTSLNLAKVLTATWTSCGTSVRIFFSILHNLAHPGANTSIKLLTDVWLRMKSDIRLSARTYEECQRA